MINYVNNSFDKVLKPCDAQHSFHLRGMAADIYPKDGNLERLWRTIGELFVLRKIGITECYIDRKRRYIHIAHNPEEFNEWPFISN